MCVVVCIGEGFVVVVVVVVCVGVMLKCVDRVKVLFIFDPIPEKDSEGLAEWKGPLTRPL